MIDTHAEVAAISSELRSLSSTPVDPAPVIRTALPFYGVSVRHLRRIATRWHREHPGAEPAAVARTADALWATSIREEMVVAALLHGHDRASREPMGLRRADRWARSLDNWETSDAMGAWLVAKAVGDEPERRFPMLETLAGRRHPWARRVGLVGCLGTARGPDAAEWWPRVAGIVLHLADDREAAIPKAISWVLRVHTGTIPGRVAGFLDEYEAVLPAIAKRETRNKLRTGTKRG